MSQNDIIKELEKEDWLSAEELRIRLNLSKGAINLNLKKLLGYNEVMRKSKKLKDNRFYYYVYSLTPHMRRD